MRAPARHGAPPGRTRPRAVPQSRLPHTLDHTVSGGQESGHGSPGPLAQGFSRCCSQGPGQSAVTSRLCSARIRLRFPTRLSAALRASPAAARHVRSSARGLLRGSWLSQSGPGRKREGETQPESLRDLIGEAGTSPGPAHTGVTQGQEHEEAGVTAPGESRLPRQVAGSDS